jgi:hypothetical protein
MVETDVIPAGYKSFSTSLHIMLSLQSYRAVLDVNRKDPSPLQFDAATLHAFCEMSIYHMPTLHNIQSN